MTLEPDVVRARCGDIEDALAMARFRSVLVLMYARVEPARVHEILREHLGDLRAFAQAVARLVDPSTPSGPPTAMAAARPKDGGSA